MADSCGLRSHQLGGPTDAHKQPIRPADSNFVKSPLAVTKDAAGADDQVIHARGNGIHFRSADENTEGIVFFRNLPGPGVRWTSQPQPVMMT